MNSVFEMCYLKMVLTIIRQHLLAEYFSIFISGGGTIICDVNLNDVDMWLYFARHWHPYHVANHDIGVCIYIYVTKYNHIFYLWGSTAHLLIHCGIVTSYDDRNMGEHWHR